MINMFPNFFKVWYNNRYTIKGNHTNTINQSCYLSFCWLVLDIKIVPAIYHQHTKPFPHQSTTKAVHLKHMYLETASTSKCCCTKMHSSVLSNSVNNAKGLCILNEMWNVQQGNEERCLLDLCKGSFDHASQFTK